jgi:hypothetical protein
MDDKPIPPPLPSDLALDLAAAYARAAATPGEWIAGRGDMLSYHEGGGGPFKNVYVDDPNGKIHMGERLPAVVCEAQEALGVDCRDNAAFIAAARTDLPAAIRLAAHWKREAERMAIDVANFEDDSWRQLYLDAQTDLKKLASVADARLAAAEAECERLRQEIEYWKLSALAKP